MAVYSGSEGGIMTTVSIILPTYNERQTIRQAVARVRAVVEPYWEHEVIVVDDDSPDGTAEYLADVYDEGDGVRAIVRTGESGLSSAVLRGMDAAKGDAYAVMDADLQHPPSSLPPLLFAVVEQRADVAVGSRHADTGDVAAEWPLWRQVVSYGAATLAKGAVPQARQLTDPMSGFFAVRADVVDAVRPQLRPCGYKILLELLARCPVDRVDEYGYTFREREKGSSNLGPIEYVRYVRHLSRLVVPARLPTRKPTPAPSPEVDD